MTDDRTLERAARAWLEEGPARAPDRPVEAALTRIQSTPQVRDLWVPWRFRSMHQMIRFAALAAVAAVAVGVGAFALRPGETVGPPSATASATPTAAPAPTPTAFTGERPLRKGTYLADIPVGEILATLAADPTLTEQEKTAVIDDILHIRDATTLHVKLVVTDATLNLLQAADDGPFEPAFSRPWVISGFDARTITVVQDGDSGTQRYAIDAFPGDVTLRPLTPAASAVETFVRRILFQAKPLNGPT